MTVTAILPAGSGSPFTAWATLPHTLTVKRLAFRATCQCDALEQAFLLVPGAVAMSVRQDDSQPPQDALAILDRRAQA